MEVIHYLDGSSVVNRARSKLDWHSPGGKRLMLLSWMRPCQAISFSGPPVFTQANPYFSVNALRKPGL